MSDKLNYNPEVKSIDDVLASVIDRLDNGENNGKLTNIEKALLKKTLKELKKQPNGQEILEKINTKLEISQALAGLSNEIKSLKAEQIKKNGKFAKKPSEEFLQTILNELKGIPDTSLKSKETKKENTTSVEEPKKLKNCIVNKEFKNLDFSTKALERSVGLSDLMPATVREVKITKADGKTQIASRKPNSLSGNFYTSSNNSYAKIFNNYSVKITKTVSAEEIKKIETKFRGNFSQDSFKEAEHNVESAENEKNIIYEEALNFGIDPNLLLALRKTENGKVGREMGILTSKTVDFRDQVKLAARSIQNSSQRFENKYKNQEPTLNFWSSFGIISAEGLAFCSSRYCTDGSEHAQLWAKVYENLTGKSLDISSEIKANFVDKSAQSLDGNYYLTPQGEIGANIERSRAGTTMCSRTTRKLFRDCAGLGMNSSVKSGDSATNSMNINKRKYGNLPTTLPNDSTQNCIDIYLTSNSKYGHRAFGYKYKGSWIVVDPYRNAGQGVSFEDYASINTVIGIKGHRATKGSIVDKLS